MNNLINSNHPESAFFIASSVLVLVLFGSYRLSRSHYWQTLPLAYKMIDMACLIGIVCLLFWFFL